MKQCTRCKTTKPLSEFYSSNTHRDGYMSHCKTCESARCKARNALNKETRLAVAKKWRDNNKETYNASLASWRERNPGKYERSIKNWVARNRGKVNAKWMKRNAGKKQRTPNWLSENMLDAIKVEYELAAWCSDVMGVKYHVDHVVPLQGKTVCGLHVPWNLQVIQGTENQAKSNKFSSLEAA